MGNYTIVIHGTGAHHNWAKVQDPRDDRPGRELISGRSNDYDADLMFAEFVDALKTKGHNITGATFTHGGMEGADSVIRADYQNPHLPPREKPKSPYGQTIFELSFGGDGHPERRRYFGMCWECDAVVRFAQAVTMLDQDAEVSCAWACLRRLPDVIYPDGLTLANWTKCSDERPTARGADTPEEAAK